MLCFNYYSLLIQRLSQLSCLVDARESSLQQGLRNSAVVSYCCISLNCCILRGMFVLLML